MKPGVQTVVGSTAFVFILCRAQIYTGNMCSTFVSQATNTNYTFSYQPGNDTCCCTVRLVNTTTNITMSSNVTYFLLVPLSGEPTQYLQNGTYPRFGNNTSVCAKKMPHSTMTAFNLRCGQNNSDNIAYVPVTSGSLSPINGEESTSTVPSGTANTKRAPTTFPPSSTTTAHTEEPVEPVLWIVIGSVAGGLIVIIGIIICVCVKRNQSKLIRRGESFVMGGYQSHGTSNNNLHAEQDSANPVYSPARVQGPVLESRAQETDNGNERLMAENCLYHHDEGHKVDNGPRCDSNISSQESNFDYLYAKVNKTSRIRE